MLDGNKITSKLTSIDKVVNLATIKIMHYLFTLITAMLTKCNSLYNCQVFFLHESTSL